jgi:hypothetical protein
MPPVKFTVSRCRHPGDSTAARTPAGGSDIRRIETSKLLQAPLLRLCFESNVNLLHSVALRCPIERTVATITHYSCLWTTIPTMMINPLAQTLGVRCFVISATSLAPPRPYIAWASSGIVILRVSVITGNIRSSLSSYVCAC